MPEGAMQNGGRAIALLTWILAMWLTFAGLGKAAEKTIILDDLPKTLETFDVAPDGQRLFFSASREILVLDAGARVIDRFPAYAPKGCVPLPDGRHVVFESHAKGRIAMFRADGSEESVLVKREGNRQSLRRDQTGWTSPCGGAVDAKAGLIFALDVTMAPRDDRKIPDPDWSRIAVFDLACKFVRDIHAFSAYPKDGMRNGGNRTWYDGIALDPARQRIYVTARRTKEILCFTYEGRVLDRQPGVGPVAVFPDGRVASLTVDRKRIVIYPASAFDLVIPTAPGKELAVDYAGLGLEDFNLEDAPPPGTPRFLDTSGGVVDMGVDAGGRLYASVQDPTITFVRWTADLARHEEIGPNYLHLRVDLPAGPTEAGAALTIPVAATGRPAPGVSAKWRAFMRPSDGTDLQWMVLGCELRDGAATVTVPEGIRGAYELALSFGDAPAPVSGGDADPCFTRHLVVASPGSSGSVTVMPDLRRPTYQAGEAIPFHIVLRGSATTGGAPVTLTLTGPLGELCRTNITVETSAAWELPPTLTRRLAPGEYTLAARAEALTPWPLKMHIAGAELNSPMQCIQYNEFGGSPFDLAKSVTDIPNRMALLRDYAAELARLGFTRQTDRLGNRFVDRPPAVCPPNTAPLRADQPGLPPADWFRWPVGNWEPGFYLDQAVRHGLRYDTQVLYHCDGVKFRDYHLDRFVPAIQRLAQWLGRYPSFYGFNYNDEMFFGGEGWTEDDSTWIKQKSETEFAGRPKPEVLFHALRTMYDAFNAAVRQANPTARITTTPMWQFPAVEGSYAPVIYEGMDETYTHYLSEGFHMPWYPSHSVDFLKRPGMPVMGVFDNSYHYRDSDGYLQDLMQVLGRGVQGAGVQHFHPWQDPTSADAYRVGNQLAKTYGAIYSQAPPIHEAAVLYSYTQDITERRNMMGTPQFERVFEFHGAALMAGLSPAIVYEEDLAAGWLLADDEPRVPMLFLLGLTQALPERAQDALRAFVRAGGRVFSDADTTQRPGEAVPLDIETHRMGPLYAQGLDADTQYILAQSVFEELAVKLRQRVGHYRRLPLDSDNPWVAVGAFDGGAATYLHLATDEAAPLPWPAPDVWSLGAFYRHTTAPKIVNLHFPFTGGVVYDVFERRLVSVKKEAGTADLEADLRTMPGRLYALLPKPVGPPATTAKLFANGRLELTVRTVGIDNTPLAARIPLRLRLRSPAITALDVYRGTDAEGKLNASLWLPAGDGPWSVEVTELLGGTRSKLALPALPLTEAAIAQPAVRVMRRLQIDALLDNVAQAGRVPPATEETTLDDELEAMLNDEDVNAPAWPPPGVAAVASLSPGQVGLLAGAPLSPRRLDDLTQAFAKRGIELVSGTELPKKPQPATYLVVDILRDGRPTNPLLTAASRSGLLPVPVNTDVPGAGGGMITAVFAPRWRAEHAVVLLGGDNAGLDRAVDRFLDDALEPPSVPPEAADLVKEATSRPDGETDLPRLSDQVGIHLDQVTATPDGRFLAVSAKGYLGNVALVEDLGDRARLVKAGRVGQGPRTGHLWLSADGTQVGASVRVTAAHGNEFRLLDGGGFAAFGDFGRTIRAFGVAGDGQTVIAPGPYGAVCWQRAGASWREAWSLDAWKEFARLEWPISADDERNPEWQAAIPRGTDFALLLHSEKSPHGWIKPEFPGAADLRAVSLVDGTERWHFQVPIRNQLLFPALHTSPDGNTILLQVQVGSWNSESYRLFSINAQGKLFGDWPLTKANRPVVVAVADRSGDIAVACMGRLVDLRRRDGSRIRMITGHHQPISIAFALDGGHLYVADDAGLVTAFNAEGAQLWQTSAGCVSRLAATPRGLIAAGWDGRLRAYDPGGLLRWELDCTTAMVAVDELPHGAVLVPDRQPTTQAAAPSGENLLATGRATLTLGGTVGWKSEGKLQVTAGELTDGKRDTPVVPWLSLDELFWSATAGRQVWAEITFPEPTDVGSLTVYESPNHPDAWPTDAVVQSWDEHEKRWQTVSYGAFLNGSVNTYRLSIKGVTKLRYVVLANYFRNLHTSEIEVRAGK